MLNKINNLSMPTQLLLIILTAFILVLTLFFMIVFPVCANLYEKKIFHDLNNISYVENVNSNSNLNDIYFVYGIENGIIVDSSNISVILSTDNVESIKNRLFSMTTSSYNYKFVSSKGETVYAHFYQKNSAKYVVMTTDKMQEGISLSNLYTIVFIPMFASFLIPLILVFVWLWDISKSINKVNNYLLSYENDFQYAKLSNKQLKELIYNFHNYHEKIRSKDVEKQILFQNISHELKTPITTIKMYAEGIEDGLYKNNDLMQSTAVIKDQTTELLNKVSKIMQINKLSHIEALNKNAVSGEKIILSDILFKVLNKYKDIASYVKFNVELEPIVFRGTKEIWTNIFENIFDNNIRHGATIITITMSDSFLVIENNGDLISEKIIDSIFEPFIRGEGGNYGLGMSIIKKSLELYKYKIKVYNTNTTVVYMIFD